MSEVMRSLDELTMGHGIQLEELVHKGGLDELLKSFHALFRVPVRLFAEDGKLLAEAWEPPALYAHLSGLKHARALLQDVIDRVKALMPGAEGDISFPCVTGATYRVSAVTYDGRRLGRLIFGPFLTPGTADLPQALYDAEPALVAEQARALLAELPRAREETVGQIAEHLRRTLDLVLFSGHKALLTSNMHLASVRESFRELEAKNSRLTEAYERLKELDRLKSNFLATVSHELRTPLTSIIGYSEMLYEGIAGDMNAEQRDFVGTIREKGEQLLELIKSLLDLSKLESGTMTLKKKDTPVVQVISDVASTLTPTARKKGVSLGVEAPPDLPTIWADAERLRQVFLNLTENAIKFTPAGGSVTLRASAAQAEAPGDEDGLALFANKRRVVEVRVIDTGVGIPEHERPKVFDAFYQVDSSSTREAGGAGLGLSIVRRLVDGHAGSIRIEGNEPTGTQVVVALPCDRPKV